MPDEIDYDAYMPKAPVPVAPLPEVAPAPGAQSGEIDYDSFMPQAPGAQSPGFNMAKFLGPAPAEPTGPIQTQVTVDAPVDEAPAESLPWGTGVIGRRARAGVGAGARFLTGPLTMADLLVRKLVGDTGPAGKYSMLGAYQDSVAADAAEARAAATYDESTAQRYIGGGIESMANPTNLLPVGAGMRAAQMAPAILGTAAATKAAVTAGGTAGGLLSGSMSVSDAAQESGGVVTSKDLANAIVQGAIEKFGGQVSGPTGDMRRIAGPSAAMGKGQEFAKDVLVNEPLPEALVGVGQGISDSLTKQGRLPTLAESADAAASSAVGGAMASSASNAPLAAQESLTAKPAPRQGPLLPYAEHSRLEALWNNLGVQDPSARIDQRTLESTPAAPVTTDTTAGYQDPNGPQRPYDEDTAEDPLSGFDPEQIGDLARLDGGQETVAAEAVQEARAQQDTAPDIAQNPAPIDPENPAPGVSIPYSTKEREALAAKKSGPDVAPVNPGVQGREQRSAAETQVFTPEQLARQKSEVQAANNDKVNQDYLDRQAAQQDEAPVRQASPKTAETQVDLAPVGQAPAAKPSQGKLDFQAAPEQGPAQPSPAQPSPPKPAQGSIDFDAKPPSALDTANQYIDTVVAPEARVQARKALVGWNPELDPEGYKGNIAMLVMAKHPAEGKRLAGLIKAEKAAPAPAPAATAPADLGPLVEPAPDKQRITPAPRPRGTAKLPELVRKHLGAKGFARKVPSSMTPDRVRLFKDASHHDMEVSEPKNGLAIAYDKDRNVAVVVARTDSKGRKNPNGTEWRALAADDKESWASYVGEPGVTLHKGAGGKSALELAGLELVQRADINLAPRTSTPEGSQSDGGPTRISRNTPAPKAAETDEAAPRSVEAAGRSQEIADLQKELAPLSARATSRTNPLTDEEVARAEALEDEIVLRKEANAKADKAERDAKAAPAPKDQSKADKAKENSPLTPKLRKNFEDNITQDDLASVPPRQVGQMIERFLTDGLGKKPTQAEVAAAIRDLEGHELLQPGQAVAPGTSVALGSTGGNLFSDPMTKWVVDTANKALGRDAAKILENAISDISMDQSIQVDVKHESRPGSFGYRYNTAVHAVTRALNWTGPLGNWIERTLARQILGVPVDLVAQSHPAFRPVLKAVRDQMDIGRQRIAEAADRLTPLTSLEGEEYEHAKGALISFRLEGKNGRAKADFGNPVRYTDEMDRLHVYTLTPKELDAVEQTFAANKTLLKNHVEGLLEALGLPTNLTHKALVQGIANGTIPPGAKIVDEMLHTLETGSDSYVPLRRRGPNVVLVYDQTKYRAAKNASQRKAALLLTSNTTTLEQTRKAVSNALHAHPTALITVHDRGPLAAVTPEEEVSERDLLDLAESAGVSPGVLQMFMSSGVADYFATRGTKARFVGANKMSGFDHDMKSVNVDHAVQMTHALMSIKYGRKVEDAMRLKALGGDKALQKFAQHYVNSQTAPTPWGISNIKQFEIAHYLGGAAVSAMFNMATSFLTAPSYALQMSFNPVQSLKFFGEAAKQHARGTLALVGRGHLYGKSRAQISADAWKATNPAMAKAILDAGHSGLYEGKYDSSIDDLAKYGEVRGITKVSQVAMNGLMHMFSVAETGNRLSAFVAAYQMFESAQSAFKASKAQFYGMAKKNNLSVDSAAAFARDFTNFVHHRNDKTEGSTITRGSADKSGVFQNSTWRQALFILKNYAVNTAVQQLRIAKAAVAQGLISSAVYAGIALSHIMLFGALNVIPGASTLAAIKDHFSDSPQTTKDQMQNHGAMGAIGSTGLLGHTAGKVSPLAGKYLDIVSQRVNNGGAIPSSVGTNTFVPIASIQEVAHAYDDVMSGDTARQIRGVATVLRSTKNLAEYGVAAAEGTGKTSTTGAAVVAGKGKGDIITKANGGKIKMPELTTLDLIAGAVGITPPVVSDAYEAIAEETKRKAANDKMFSLLTHRGAAALYMKVGSPERVKAFQDIGRDLAEWNAAAKKAGRPTDIILPVTLGHGIRTEREAQGSGAFNLKRTQKLGRPEAVKALDEVAPENRPLPTE